LQKTESTHSRAYIAAFRPDGSMLWSTQYGMGDENTVMDICASGNKVWIVGSSDKDWTFEEYVDGEGSDYYRALSPVSEQLPEATIARFDIPLTVNTNEIVQSSLHDVVLYPNPTNGLVYIDGARLPNASSLNISLYNSHGQLLNRMALMGSKNHSIDLTPYPSGLYHVSLILNDQTYSASIIKQ
jgi:Secretion system C-terminal sorting domain